MHNIPPGITGKNIISVLEGGGWKKKKATEMEKSNLRRYPWKAKKYRILSKYWDFSNVLKNISLLIGIITVRILTYHFSIENHFIFYFCKIESQHFNFL